MTVLTVYIFLYGRVYLVIWLTSSLPSHFTFLIVLFFSLADSLYVLATLFRLCEMLVVDNYPVCILNTSACNFNNMSSQ